MSKKAPATRVANTHAGLPVYKVKEIVGREGIGVCLFRLGIARRSSSLPFAVAVVDHTRGEYREVNRYIQKSIPMSGGADAISQVARWGPRQTALQRFDTIVREIRKRN